MRILLAVGSPAQRDVIGQALAKIGYGDFATAADGARALALLRDGAFDVLLADGDLPPTGGIELAEQVRRDEALAGVHVVIMSERKRKSDIVAAVRAGVSAYLVKPFSPAHLKNKLDKACRTRAYDATRRAEELFAGSAPLDVRDEFPFVMFVEKSARAADLAQPHNRAALDYLVAADQALEALNDRYPDLALRYVLASDAHQLVQHFRAYRDRLKLIVLAAEEASSVTVARLARINQDDEFTVCLVADHFEQFSAVERDRFERLGILLLERRRINAEILEWFFREHVFSRRHRIEVADQVPVGLRDRLERDIELMESLPVLPQVYHRVMALERGQELLSAPWIEAIEADPLSSAMLLRRAQSPLYGGSEADTVEKAFKVLGKEVVKQLLVYGNMKASVGDSQDAPFRVEDFWLHSMAVGRTAYLLCMPSDPDDWDHCRRVSFDALHQRVEVHKRLVEWGLAAKLALPPGEDPFVGGLMHDMGKAVISQCYPVFATAVAEQLQKRDWQAPMAAVEQELMGLDHTYVGEVLGRTWKIEPTVARVIADHHAPDPRDHLGLLVALADFIAGAAFPYPRRGAYPPARLLARYRAEQDPVVDLDEATSAQMGAFLPDGLLDLLDLDLDEVLEMALLLAPSVEQYAGQVQEGLRGI